MEFVEEHLFEMMLGGTFALGWVSCYLTMKVFEVRGDRKKLEKESQTLASTESSGSGGENLKVFQNGYAYHKVTCKHVRSRPNQGCGNSWFESHRWWLAGARVCEFPPGTVRTLEPTVSTGDCWVESI